MVVGFFALGDSMLFGSSSPDPGDVWYAVPTGALALWHDPARPQRPIPLVITGRDSSGNPQWDEIITQHTGGAYAEYETAAKILVKRRPGLLCSVTRDDGQAVITPSWGREIPPAYNGPLPRHEVELPFHPHETKNDVRFEFWNMWGIDVDDLLYSRRPVPPGEVPVIKRLMMETLGLDTPTWIPSGELDRVRRKAQIRRGELIWVALPLENRPVPMVVISDDALNGVDSELIVALQTVEYDPDDDDSTSVLPLHPPKNAKANLGLRFGQGQALSVDLTMVRGLRVQRRNSGKYGISLENYSGILRTINKNLRRIHG